MYIKEIRRNTLYDFVYTDLDMKCIETLLYYIDELEAKLEFKQFGDLDNAEFEEQYLSKEVIKNKIKEIEETPCNTIREIHIDTCIISTLKELLE